MRPSLLLLILLCMVQLSKADTINITNGEWEPFLSEYCYEYGLASHIVTEAFKEQGIVVNWGFYPWKRSYIYAKTGEDWHASAVWWPSDDAKEHFLLSDAVVPTSNVFFHLKSFKFEWNNISDLKEIPIGVTIGYDYGQEFMTALKNNELRVQEVSSDELNYKKLLANRIKLFPNDPIVGLSQIKNSLRPEEAELITYHPLQFETSTLHLIISKNTPKAEWILIQFNEGLKKLKEKGRIDEMYEDLRAGKYAKQKSKWIREK